MQNTSSTYSYKIINDHFSTRRLQSNYSLSLTLLCYSQTIQAINALTSPSDRHNYKKTEQCNSSIQDGLFEHSVTPLSYPSPCLRGNFSPQKRHKERGGTLLPSPQSPSHTCRKSSPWLVLATMPACLLEKDSAPSCSGTHLGNQAHSTLLSPISGTSIPAAPARALRSQKRGGRRKGRWHGAQPGAVCLGFSKRIFLFLCCVHCSSLTPAEA